MDKYLKLTDTLSGTEGAAYITIDGKNRPLFEISSLDAQLELTVQSRRLGGHRMTQHKVIGGEGTGSMTMYFMNSDMLKMAINYIKSGAYGGIKLQVSAGDSQSSVGTQDVVLTNVILSTIPVTKLDDQSEDPITVDTDFTFDDVEGFKYFALPIEYR